MFSYITFIQKKTHFLNHPVQTKQQINSPIPRPKIRHPLLLIEQLLEISWVGNPLRKGEANLGNDSGTNLRIGKKGNRYIYHNSHNWFPSSLSFPLVEIPAPNRWMSRKPISRMDVSAGDRFGPEKWLKTIISFWPNFHFNHHLLLNLAPTPPLPLPPLISLSHTECVWRNERN